MKFKSLSFFLLALLLTGLSSCAKEDLSPDSEPVTLSARIAEHPDFIAYVNLQDAQSVELAELAVDLSDQEMLWLANWNNDPTMHAAATQSVMDEQPDLVRRLNLIRDESLFVQFESVWKAFVAEDLKIEDLQEAKSILRAETGIQLATNTSCQEAGDIYYYSVYTDVYTQTGDYMRAHREASFASAIFVIACIGAP